MTIISSFSANFPPDYHTILSVNCVQASTWFTHLQPTQESECQNDNSCIIILLYIWIALLHLKCCIAELLLRAELICAS